VRQIGKDVTYLPLHVITVGLEQMQDVLQHTFPRKNRVHLESVASCDVRHHPAGLPPHYLLVVL
jgi:hypothetical protein